MAELEAGPELDCQVAIAVFGWRIIDDDPDMGAWLKIPDDDPTRTWLQHAFGSADTAPRYSAEMQFAWLVVERLADLGHTKWQVDHDQDGYTAMFSRLRPGCAGHAGSQASCGCWEWVQRSGDTAPLAICRAALAAVGP